MLGSTIITRFQSWLHGKLAGEDEYGNQYFYSQKKVDDFGREARWVLYKGVVESSKVPANWHGWLHYMVDLPPSSSQKYSWQKSHLPNLSGTLYAYNPPLYREPSLETSLKTLDYQPWKPFS